MSLPNETFMEKHKIKLSMLKIYVYIGETSNILW